MKVEFKNKWDDTVSFNETPELKEKVYQAVLNWYKEQNAFFGESIMQSDNPQIDAAPFLSTVCDKMFKFKIKD